MTSGFGIAPWPRTVQWGFAAVERAICQGKSRRNLPTSATVVSCYEAGRDGFWIHRALTTLGIRNRVVDSASIEVNRRARRTKTDRIDALKLVMMLVRVCCGEPRGVAGGPGAVRGCGGGAAWEPRAHGAGAGADAVAESDRQLAGDVRVPRVRRGGVSRPPGGPVPVIGRTPCCRRRCKRGSRARRRGWPRRRTDRDDRHQSDGDGAASGSADGARRASCSSKAWRRRAPPCCSMKAWSGASLKSAANWRLVGIRAGEIRQRRVGTRQGISRAGNKRLQSVMVQLAWGWVLATTERADPWYRSASGRGRPARRVGIVALARKLLIALWRYATAGVVPTGAVLKAGARYECAEAFSHARCAYGVCPGRRERPSRRSSAALVFGLSWTVSGGRASRASSDRRRRLGSGPAPQHRTRVTTGGASLERATV